MSRREPGVTTKRFIKPTRDNLSCYKQGHTRAFQFYAYLQNGRFDIGSFSSPHFFNRRVDAPALGKSGCTSDQSCTELYLKKLGLFNACSDLRMDVDVSFVQPGHKVAALLPGPWNTVTGMHCDPNNRNSAQVDGSKKTFYLRQSDVLSCSQTARNGPDIECCEADVLPMQRRRGRLCLLQKWGPMNRRPHPCRSDGAGRPLHATGVYGGLTPMLFEACACNSRDIVEA